MCPDRTPKRPRFLDEAQIKLKTMAEAVGREIRLFTTIPSSPVASVSNTDENDDYYEFTAEDYYRLLSGKKEDKYLKTRKIREAEEAARRSKITKALIRIRFPDNLTVEAKFQSSETVQDLIDLLKKVVARPEIPFYIYTTPPKKQLSNVGMNFYDAGFIPGAIVYFSYDLSKVDDPSFADAGPFLREDVLALKDVDFAAPPQQTVTTVQAMPEAAVEVPLPNNSVAKPEVKKTVKPKWLKM